MGFLIHRPGTYSMLVDQGRPASRHLGLPVGGPADRAAWMLGNALVGNLPTAPALEITLHGPALEATAAHMLVVYGADFDIKLLDKAGNLLHPIPPAHVFHVQAGQQIAIGGLLHAGLRAYVCVAGGWIGGNILGSCTMLEPIQPATTWECGIGRCIHPRWADIERWADIASPDVLRLLPGTHVTKKIQTLIEQTTFTVRSESNRMGIRLDSAQTWPNEQGELLSAPVVPGTLQLPAGGQPIILGVDAQTIGGYPRLGHVISADIDHLGQLRPGTSIRFELVTAQQAEKLRISRQHWLREWLDRLHWSL